MREGNCIGTTKSSKKSRKRKSKGALFNQMQYKDNCTFFIIVFNMNEMVSHILLLRLEGYF